MRFESPQTLWLFILLIPLIAIYILRDKRKKSALFFSRFSAVKIGSGHLFLYLRHSVLFFRVLGFSCLIIALARPQVGNQHQSITSEGIDIMLALDLSTSMKALDFKPSSRLKIAKEKAQQFIQQRSGDRIGLTVFSGRSYVKCPLTLDYTLLSHFITDLDFSQSMEDGTAIGTAIATAAKNIMKGESDTRVIILLTDGANNRGDIQPVAAAKAAAKMGIRIHTVAIGREGLVPYPVIQNGRRVIVEKESEYDSEELQQIADISGGEFFIAESGTELEQIYSVIDRLEKTEVEIKKWTDWEDRFYPWLIAGFLLLLLDFILSYTRFRRIP
jgi:Ca-activated chloride channel family protein